MATLPAQPHEWHAIRYDQVRRVQNLPETGIALCFHNAMHSSGGNRMTPVAIVNPFRHLGDNVGDLHGVDLHSQNWKAVMVFGNGRREWLGGHGYRTPSRGCFGSVDFNGG